MHEPAVVAWLRGRCASRARWSAAAAVTLALVAALALCVTFWATYVIVWFILAGLHPLSHGALLAVSAGALALFFIANARVERRDLEELSFSTGTASEKIVVIGHYTNINPLAPDSMHSFVKMLSWMPLFGPRVTVAALRHAGKAWRLWRIDAAACAEVIEYLASRTGRASFEETAGELRDIDPVAAFSQLRDVDGVVFLVKSDPPGLVLSDEIKAELASAT